MNAGLPSGKAFFKNTGHLTFFTFNDRQRMLIMNHSNRSHLRHSLRWMGAAALAASVTACGGGGDDPEVRLAGSEGRSEWVNCGWAYG